MTKLEQKLFKCVKMLLLYGAHKGRCSNEYYDDEDGWQRWPNEGCSIHWQTSKKRQVKAQKLINEIEMGLGRKPH